MRQVEILYYLGVVYRMVEGVPEPPPMEKVPGIWIFSLETQIRDFKIHLGLCNIGIHLNTFQPILCNINIIFY